MTETKPLRIDKVYSLCVKAGLLDEAEFIKGLDRRFDILKNKTKVKRGTTTHKKRVQNTVL